MFDAIAAHCDELGLRYTVWVDDLTVSGHQIPGAFVARLRAIIAAHRLRSHKLRFRTGNRAVFITGVGVVGGHLVVPHHLERRSKEFWREFQDARRLEDVDGIDAAGARLLAHLGGIRHVVGPASARGQKLASEMNSVRQKRNAAFRIQQERMATQTQNVRHLSTEELEERRDEIAAVPF